MRVLGLSSGTSADGIDVAAADLTLDGDLVRLRPLGHRTVPYSAPLHEELRSALPPGTTTMETVCRLDTGIGQAFAAAAREAVADLAGGHADLVASHGQTLFHWADGASVHGTLQLGQPAWTAEATGLPVVSDLRTADVAAGGQGAPLAALLDTLLLNGRGVPAAALNIGGIANATVVPTSGEPAAFDTGPGNALMDAAVRRATGGRSGFDLDGRLAAEGRVDAALLDRLLADPYYRLAPPKSTGLELFGPAYLEEALHEHGPVETPDLLATLVELTARTVADALASRAVAEVHVSGGGARNPVLTRRLAELLRPARLSPAEDLGLDGDAKEAYLFALLGFFTWHGLPGALPSCTGARRATPAGRLTPGSGPLRLPEPAATVPRRLEVTDPAQEPAPAPDG
ncbi:anhydro-N-acetylmuramic acid kinase [Nocardiopsis sp. HNM0947]|uniref:Anhydro-N-acetylmuramic acid kinase n=1 Tax=Nocardiopsis coralli TaxID=2772213 RepID=A0ABR9PAH3_9ACTN|nr:anhydro-N-acetylmuramic acid kinase [Nocardiopsis coralli]MBE3000832.1 anhydro-N-acetylmuramic acid kinase [Nocardiopsis coralli]